MNSHLIACIANCGCWYAAEAGVPCSHDIAEAKRQGLKLPDDYEACGDCGYDHSYEYNEARIWHNERNG